MGLDFCKNCGNYCINCSDYCINCSKKIVGFVLLFSRLFVLLHTKASNQDVEGMKRYYVALLLTCLLSGSCSDNRRGVSGQLSSVEADSTDTEKADSLAQAARADEMPTGADELFDDFFFNYASSLRRQRERTLFPLTVTDGEAVRTITKKQWKQDSFFMNQDYYTLFFDSPAQEQLISDTAVVDATVERFYLDKGRVEQFLFSRKSGRWMLHEVVWQDLPRNPNGQFLKFYQQFVGDSLFQRKSLAEQIEFSGPDPDDDFSTLDGMITPDFWDAFRPDFPQHILYNIVYGHQNPATTQKILLLCGIANGMEMEITFRQHRGRWKLTKLNM